MSDFKTIGLIGKYADPSVAETLARLNTILTDHQLDVLLDESTAHVVEDHGMEIAERNVLGETCDLVIVVGGDGTLLNAARSLSDYGVPLLGVNLGRLGFLVDISPSILEEAMEAILKGEYQEETRSLLGSCIERDGVIFGENAAFNDVVVHKSDVARMVEIETYVNGQFMSSMHADGLIVSTPTGSTAYALSGGGPILYPSLQAMVLVPICPHTMSNRPVVVSDESEIELFISEKFSAQAQITCDGQINFSLVPGDKIKIKRKEKPVRIIHPTEYDYFEILRAKLRWGEKLSN